MPERGNKDRQSKGNQSEKTQKDYLVHSRFYKWMELLVFT